MELASLTSPETKVVAEDADHPIYAAGSLLFVRNGKIFGQPFDPTSGKLSGAASPITDGGAFSTAGSSVLAFHASSPEARLAWLDLNGNQQVITETPAQYIAPSISPDGKQILVMVGDPQNSEFENNDLWSLPTNGGVGTRLTFGPGPKLLSVWSPDGKYFAYASATAGQAAAIFRKSADGSGTEETLFRLEPDVRIAAVNDWSPDGRYLSYVVFSVRQSHFASWVLPLFGDRTPFQVAPPGGNQFAGKFSPDGHWFACFSDENGRHEVYVVPFPGPGGKYQISRAGGGTSVAWSKKNELFFISTGNRLMKADLTLTSRSLHVDALRTLFPVDLLDRPMPLFDVSSDGKRILIVTPARPESDFISLLLNWPALLKK